jgi:hypothetical protein
VRVIEEGKSGFGWSIAFHPLNSSSLSHNKFRT